MPLPVVHDEEAEPLPRPHSWKNADKSVCWPTFPLGQVTGFLLCEQTPCACWLGRRGRCCSELSAASGQRWSKSCFNPGRKLRPGDFVNRLIFMYFCILFFAVTYHPKVKPNKTFFRTLSGQDLWAGLKIYLHLKCLKPLTQSTDTAESAAMTNPTPGRGEGEGGRTGGLAPPRARVWAVQQAALTSLLFWAPPALAAQVLPHR